jgi:hypothetical protein
MRGYDELGKVGEREGRQIKLRFQSLGSANVIPACGITLGGFDLNAML